MYCVHEFGHVIGAMVTGGKIDSVVLSPVTISQTILSKNPSPLTVVWLGPLIGVIVPTLVWIVIPNQFPDLKRHVQFFAGFCLIANGAYIGAGSIELIGDCKQMYQSGTPRWVMIVFGIFASIAGLFTWHQIGEVRSLWSLPSTISWQSAIAMATAACTAALVLYFNG